MDKPVFKNNHHERVLYLSTPNGGMVVVHPGQMVAGEYFRPQVNATGMLVELSREEAEPLTRANVQTSC